MKSIVQTHLIPRQFVFKVINESLPPTYLRKTFYTHHTSRFHTKIKDILKKKVVILNYVDFCFAF